MPHLPVYLTSSSLNGPLVVESEADHCNLLASGSEMTVAGFAIATSESDSIFFRSEPSESSRRGRPHLDDITMIMNADGGTTKKAFAVATVREISHAKSHSKHTFEHIQANVLMCVISMVVVVPCSVRQKFISNYTPSSLLILVSYRTMFELCCNVFIYLPLGCENQLTPAIRHEHPTGVRRDKVTAHTVVPMQVTARRITLSLLIMLKAFVQELMVKCD